MELLAIIGLALVTLLAGLLVAAVVGLWVRTARARRNASKTNLPAGITTQEFPPVES